MLISEDEITFERSAGALRRRRVTRLKALTLEAATMPLEPGGETATLLARAAVARGIDRLDWSKAQQQLRDRVGFLRQADPAGWPDLSDAALAETVEEWLAPFLANATALSAINPECLGAALDMLLPYALKQRIDKEAPTHFVAPTGNAHPIRYEGDGAPFLAIRVQELFGQKQHPMIAECRLRLTLELLSPAQRPIQITRDLPGFWAGSWGDVRTDMRGRYPRHPWPEDPANAAPTARAKPRGT